MKKLVFEVGEKVTIKTKQELIDIGFKPDPDNEGLIYEFPTPKTTGDYSSHHNYLINNSMIKFCGKEVTIKSSYFEDSEIYYNIEEDNVNWDWIGLTFKETITIADIMSRIKSHCFNECNLSCGDECSFYELKLNLSQLL